MKTLWWVTLCAATLGLLVSAGQAGEGASEAPGADEFVLFDYEDGVLVVNGDGNSFPFQYDAAGTGVVALETADAVSGAASAKLTLTAGKAYPQFNPHNYSEGTRAGVTSPRAFAREYGRDPAAWRFDTFNRLAFWVRTPVTAAPLATGGRHNVEFGTYVKRVGDADAYNDEAHGNHYYHFLNLAPTGTWTRVVLNMHPNHERGGPGGKEWGVMAHPTGEEDCNYWDAFTRFYFEYLQPPSEYPAVYGYDEFVFYQERHAEPDEAVYSIACTFVPGENRVIMTWFRNKNEDAVAHEVRYAFSDIHVAGWESANAAPGGVVEPPGEGGYNGMVYETTQLPLEGVETLYLAIRPVGSEVFSQIALRLRPAR